MSKERRRNLGEDVRWGIVQGLTRAKLYAVIALAASILKWLAGSNASFALIPKIIVGYFAAAFVAGALLGILRPLGKTLGGYLFVGAVVAVPVSLAMFAAVASKGDRQLVFPLAIGSAVFLGPLFGAVHWIARKANR